MPIAPPKPDRTTELLGPRARDLKTLLGDLYRPRGWIYWTDFLLSAGLGWAAMAWAFHHARSGLDWMILPGLLVATLAHYRCLMFAHEIAHFQRGVLPAFRIGWNALFGAPFLLPSSLYEGMHLDHHNARKYGTPEDPEYDRFAGRKMKILILTVTSPLLPLFFIARALLLAPPSWLLPAWRRVVERRFSSLALNPLYVRRMSPEESRRLLLWEIVSFAWWAAAAALLRGDVWRLLVVYYLVAGGAAFLNTLRTLGAHHYEGDGHPMDRNAQVVDSVDTPDAWWSVFWMPVGLRYHALHHFLPTMPYHNLGHAYRRLVAALTPEASYRHAISPRLSRSLSDLWQNHGPIGSGRVSRAPANEENDA